MNPTNPADPYSNDSCCDERAALDKMLFTCPNCGGEADNGYSRDVPPSAYHCTQCERMALLNDHDDAKDCFKDAKDGGVVPLVLTGQGDYQQHYTPDTSFEFDAWGTFVVGCIFGVIGIAFVYLSYCAWVLWQGGAP